MAYGNAGCAARTRRGRNSRTLRRPTRRDWSAPDGLGRSPAWSPPTTRRGARVGEGGPICWLGQAPSRVNRLAGFPGRHHQVTRCTGKPSPRDSAAGSLRIIGFSDKWSLKRRSECNLLEVPGSAAAARCCAGFVVELVDPSIFPSRLPLGRIRRLGAASQGRGPARSMCLET